MARKISQRELRNDSGAVLREVQSGQTVVVTRNGTAVAELRPLGQTRFVSRAALVEGARTLPRIDADRFRRDLDSVVDQTVER